MIQSMIRGRGIGNIYQRVLLERKRIAKKIRHKRYRNNCLKSDWTPKRLQLKLSQIKKVIFSKGRKKPEFLTLEEVENENVIKLLSKELGYSDWIVSKSPDRRGIDLPSYMMSLHL